MAEFVPVEPFDLVIFGGTGDLSERKLLPALFHRDKDCQFSDDSRIVCVSRSDLDQDAFITFVKGALDKYLKEGEFDVCLLYTSPSPRDLSTSRMPSSA